MALPIGLRQAATAAFRDNTQLAAMSQEDRERLAQWYEDLAGLAVTDGTAAPHIFHEGAAVTLSAGTSFLGLQPGDRGIVCALYDTQPPAYEVTWAPRNPASGPAFGATMYENEIAAAPAVPSLAAK